jgi:hypothetical protein
MYFWAEGQDIENNNFTSCETWSLIVRKENKLQLFVNSVLSEISGP